MNTTTPGSIGGMKVAIAWPNMWLSGSRFRNRNGKKGLPHFRYFRISRSTGTMFARMLRWVMTTPLGSAVAPDVKMISATSSRAIVASGATSGTPSPLQSSSCSFQTGASIARVAVANRRDVLADQHQLRRDDAADAREESRATRGSRSARRRCRGAGSPRTRRSIPGGSRSRRRPCRLCAGRARAGAPRTPRAARATSRVGVARGSGTRRRRRGSRRAPARDRGKSR